MDVDVLLVEFGEMKTGFSHKWAPLGRKMNDTKRSWQQTFVRHSGS